MDTHGIVVGRHTREKRELAWQMRREMTPAEALLWQRLRRSQLVGLHFRRQQVIDGFIADFYCHAAGLVLEVDGAVHTAQTLSDAERDAILAARDLQILRIPNERVEREMETVLQEVAEVALARVQALGSPHARKSLRCISPPSL